MSLPFRKRSLQVIVALSLFILLPGATLFAMGSTGPAPSEQGTAATPALPVPALQKVTTRDILNDPAKFNSSDVAVKGIFKGWTGACPPSAMLTRSDWVLEDETGCIYVSGSIPAGLAPEKPNNERIEVIGRVTMNKAGKPYLTVTQKP